MMSLSLIIVMGAHQSQVILLAYSTAESEPHLPLPPPLLGAHTVWLAPAYHILTWRLRADLSSRGDYRYEGQMQSQRLRMVSDSELRLEQFQAERKDEKRRYEDAIDRLKQVACPALPHHTLVALS